LTEQLHLEQDCGVGRDELGDADAPEGVLGGDLEASNLLGSHGGHPVVKAHDHL